MFPTDQKTISIDAEQLRGDRDVIGRRLSIHLNPRRSRQQEESGARYVASGAPVVRIQFELCFLRAYFSFADRTRSSSSSKGVSNLQTA